MKKYLMLMSLLLVGLTMAFTPDEWTSLKYQVADCKAVVLQNAFDSWAVPYQSCMSQATYSQLSTAMEQIKSEGGILNQMKDTSKAASECWNDGTVDKACLARYRQQFRSQQSTFNSLVTTMTRLSRIAGREATNPPCSITGQEFNQQYSYYMFRLALCNGGRPPA